MLEDRINILKQLDPLYEVVKKAEQHASNISELEYTITKEKKDANVYTFNENENDAITANCRRVSRGRTKLRRIMILALLAIAAIYFFVFPRLSVAEDMGLYICAAVFLCLVILWIILSAQMHRIQKSEFYLQKAREKDAAVIQQLRAETFASIASKEKELEEERRLYTQCMRAAKEMNLVREEDLRAFNIRCMMEQIRAGHAQNIEEARLLARLAHDKLIDEAHAAEEERKRKQADADYRKLIQDMENQRQVQQIFDQFGEDMKQIERQKEMKRIQEKQLETLKEIEKRLRD